MNRFTKAVGVAALPVLVVVLAGCQGMNDGSGFSNGPGVKAAAPGGGPPRRLFAGMGITDCQATSRAGVWQCKITDGPIAAAGTVTSCLAWEQRGEWICDGQSLNVPWNQLHPRRGHPGTPATAD